MAKRPTERQHLASKIDLLNDTEIKDVLDYVSHIQSAHCTRTAPLPQEDELITLLAAARENERARQAYEWEKTRRRAEHRAALMALSSYT